MRCTPIVAGLVLSSIVFATAPAQAQVSIDVSKITCDERLGLLAALRVGDAVQACHFGRRDRTASRFEDFHRMRSPRAGLYGSGARAGRR